jgi:hypothetical protein
MEQGSLWPAWTNYTVDVTRIDEREVSQARALAETVSIFGVTPILYFRGSILTMRCFEGIYGVTVGLRRMIFLPLVRYLVIVLENLENRKGYKSLNENRWPRDRWRGGSAGRPEGGSKLGPSLRLFPPLLCRWFGRQIGA